VVVEHQIAIGERIVEDTIARLQREGLSRHDGIHAVGSVLTNHLSNVLRGDAAGADLAKVLPLGRVDAHRRHVAVPRGVIVTPPCSAASG
jgi:hypothetical protein